MLLRVISILLCLMMTACGPSFLTGDQHVPYVYIPNDNRDYPDLTPGEEVTTVGGTTGYKVRAAIGEISEDVTTSNNWKVRGVFHE